MSWLYFQQDWSFAQKCTFDGINRRIVVYPTVSELDIRTDVYSGWKEWITIRDNSKYLPALRTTGGDPIGGTEFTGDVYFLVNGWKLLFDPRYIKVTGVLYSDDYNTAYWDYDGVTAIYPAKVSSVVNTIATGEVVGATADQIWNYFNRTLTSSPAFNGPTVAQIRQEMDANSVKLSAINNQTDTVKPSLAALDTKVTALPTAAENADAVWSHALRELSTTMTPQQFWDFLLSTPMAPGSAGEKLKNVLTTGNFLALK